MQNDVIAVHALVEGEGREAFGGHAGDSADASVDLLVELGEANGVSDLVGDGFAALVEREDEDVFGVEAGVDAGEFEETAEEEPGGGEEQDGEGRSGRR